VKWLLIIGVIVVALFATGAIHFEFYTTNEPAPAGASAAANPVNQVSSSIGAPPASSRLGTGVRTRAEVSWIRRMNGLCARRNRRENALPGPEDTTLALARYAARTLWIWDNYWRRATGLRSPDAYTAEAAWVQQADAVKREGIQAVLDTASSDDSEAAHAAISAFQSLARTTLPTYAKVGLRVCGQFHP
jgi:hypothetical protein